MTEEHESKQMTRGGLFFLGAMLVIVGIMIGASIVAFIYTK